MFEPKLPVIAATVGFVLSFLVGLFSGAAFPAFLLRALGMAVFFAVVAVLLHVAVRKFLPELLDGAETLSSNAAVRETGTQVDLTIGDDAEPVSPFNGADTEQEPSPVLDDTEELRYDEAVSWQDDMTAMPVKDSGPAPEASPPASTDGPVPRAEREKPGEKPKGGISGLDILPDIQDFVPEEKVVEEDAADFDDSVVVQSSGKGFSVPDIKSDGVETETMAKAIRTILSRDN